MKYRRSFSFRSLMACLVLTAGTSALQAEDILLYDDFDGPALNGSVWGLANWNIGDRTQFGNTPQFAIEGGVTFIRLPLDTYNPGAPGQRVLGTEIYSLQNFEAHPAGIEYLARARLSEDQRGLVGAFFTYNQMRQKGRWIADEIDFEVLSNWVTNQVLVTSWNDWGAPGSNYEDGVHHAGRQLTVDSFNWQQWNTYVMRWYPDHIEWWINDVKVHEQTAPVPDQPQPARASLWAAGTTWVDAFDSTLAPVSSSSANRRFYWDVDLIAVTFLGEADGGGGGGGGGDQPPAAPSALTASVDGSAVQLAWTDNASNETAYIVYRAWKPKGGAAPDFNPIATVGSNVTSHTDIAQNGEHLYRVTALNAAGESTPSNTVGVTVGSGTKGGGKPR